MAEEYQYAEAFCLMRYECGSCGHHEVLWNSRDGVTPYVLVCPHCDEDMAHTQWKLDRCEPNHMPEKGQGVFIDLPRSLYPVIARQRVQDFYGADYDRSEKEREEEIIDMASRFRDGEPFLMRW